MKRYFLGIDTGATKSHALVSDEAGRARGFGHAGPGNHQTVGYDGMAAALRRASSEALSMAGVSTDQIAAAGFGIAGFDWPSQRPRMLEVVRGALDLRLDLPVEVSNDVMLGLVAGTEEGWGVALAAGTSNNCRGRDWQGREGRVTGEGSRFGEYGGGYELVGKALHAVTAAWSMRGPDTALTPALVAYVGAKDVDDLLEGISQGYYSLNADAAPVVCGVAKLGDIVARGVVEWAGRELGDLAVGVIRQLGFERVAFNVVLVGSIFNAGPLLSNPVRETIHAVAPQARLARLLAPPVTGAALMAMEAVGIEPAPRRAMLLSTAADVLSASQGAQVDTGQA